MKIILFPFFLVQLFLATTPAMAWLLCLSFKQWKLVISLVWLLGSFVLFGLQNLSPTPPFQQALSPNEKLNRALRPYNDVLVTFQPTQPSFQAWVTTQEKYPQHRDVLVQTALGAFYVGEYQHAETMWQEAKKIDPLYPLFKTVPTLTPLTIE